jgi:hypothetical protein
MTEVTPDKAVTIGGPLPTYTIVILDPDKPAEIPDGELGEIAIAGIGLAEGYLGRPELTAQKFIPDFIGLPHNPSKRIYRTGDLGRINQDREIEFLGRIDTQVKVRGYRIELTEIESVLMHFSQVAQAVVNTFEPEPGAVELVAYYSLKQGADDLDPQEVSKTMRGQLPSYMVPAYFERLDVIPMTTSNKADRKNLPVPKGGRVSSASEIYVAPRTSNEELLASALAKVLKVDKVSVTDDFFRDLGAHSLLMARFCSDIRQSGHTDMSMRDVYLNRTVEQLAAKLDDAAAPTTAVQTVADEVLIPSNLAYYSCGALQAAFYVGFTLLGAWVLSLGFQWTYESVETTGSLSALYLRLLGFFVLSFIGFTALPIVAKWLLVGRFKEESFPVWGPKYFRFWLVKTLIRASPMAAFAGSPIQNLYLRLLGAKIGRGVVIRSGIYPITADLLSIGDGTLLSKDSIVAGYRAQGNRIHIGRISIGANAFVGEASVIDIDTVMEDGTQLGHASSLQRGHELLQDRAAALLDPSALDLCPRANTAGSRPRSGGRSAALLAGSACGCGICDANRCSGNLHPVARRRRLTRDNVVRADRCGDRDRSGDRHLPPTHPRDVPGDRPYLRSLRFTLLHLPYGFGDQQQPSLQPDFRRQLGHRLLPPMDRMESEQSRTDRIEFRHPPEA